MSYCGNCGAVPCAEGDLCSVCREEAIDHAVDQAVQDLAAEHGITYEECLERIRNGMDGALAKIRENPGSLIPETLIDKGE